MNPNFNKRISDKRRGCSFHVSQNQKCPVYRDNDRFDLRDTLLFAPAGKPTCLPLSKFIIEKRDYLDGHSKNEFLSFTCGGCGEGNRITLEHSCVDKVSEEMEKLIEILQKFSFFKLLRKDDLRELIPFLNVSHREVGEVIITKGDPGRALFVVVAGEVEVLPDESESIVTHGTGKVFGEMSLLSGDLCTATVRVTQPVKLLTMEPERFKNMIHHFPKLQKYFFQLLARRLDQTNMAVSIKNGAQIQGNLSEWKLPDLLQTLNMNNKSGLLEFSVDNCRTEVTFQNGQVCRVVYGADFGIHAFFELFRLGDVDFRFHPSTMEEEPLQPIGDFMYLMVEGLVRSDEQNNSDSIVESLDKMFPEN